MAFDQRCRKADDRGSIQGLGPSLAPKACTSARPLPAPTAQPLISVMPFSGVKEACLEVLECCVWTPFQ
jgi:hypothetical protein